MKEELFEKTAIKMICMTKLWKAVKIYREMCGHYCNESIASRMARDAGCEFGKAEKLMDFVDECGFKAVEEHVQKNIGELKAELREILA